MTVTREIGGRSWLAEMGASAWVRVPPAYSFWASLVSISKADSSAASAGVGASSSTSGGGTPPDFIVEARLLRVDIRRIMDVGIPSPAMTFCRPTD